MDARTKDLVFCGLVLVFCGAVLAGSFAYRPASAYFPQALALFMAVMAGVFGLRRLREKASPSGDAPQPMACGDPAPADDGEEAPGLRSFAIVVLAILGYVAGLAVVGFAVSTVLFLAAIMGILGERRPLVLGGVSLGLTAALYGIFFWFLGVAMPRALLSL